MKPINLQPIGEIQLCRPTPFAAIYDVVNEWGGLYNTNQIQTARGARLLCAVIGMCWAPENAGARPPDYQVTTGDPIAYGGQMMDWLARYEVELLPIYQRGSDLIVELNSELPTQPDVDAAKDFSVVSEAG